MDIKIKDVPGELHHSLKERAESHGRSLNKEVLAILEGTLNSVKATSPEDLLARIEERRNRLPNIVRNEELQKIIREGR